MSDFETLARTAASQFGLLTTAQLRSAGWDAKRVQRAVDAAQLSRIRRGVAALAGSYPSWERDLLGSVLSAGGLAAASHRSAARLWQFRSVDDQVEISIPYPADAKPHDCVLHRSRDLRRGDITWVNGIPCTTPERTLCDLGLTFPEHEVARMLRQALVEDLVNRYDLWRIRYRVGRQGRNGAGVLGRILDRLPEQAEAVESGLEVLFLELVERFGLPAPEIQFPIVVNSQCYRLDFAFPSHRVFVEIDGASHHSTPEQIANDGGRQNALVAVGWQPIRFTYQDLQRKPGLCAQQLRQTLGSVSPTHPRGDHA